MRDDIDYGVQTEYVTVTIAFRMVAELVRHIIRIIIQKLLYGRVAERAGQEHLQEQLGQVPSNYLVNSTLRVTPMLDPHSERTLTWSTLTRCRSDINMFTVPKQQPHRRDLPIIFEGNKPEQQSGSMTTFKNWAAEVQIYMSLEDHNLVTVMNDARDQSDQTVPINNAGYIDHRLHEKGLGYENGKKLRDQKLQRLMQDYTTANAGAIRKNASRAAHRLQGDTVEADEVLPPVPTLPDDYDLFSPEQRESINAYTEAFHHHSRALQYT
eukprot:2187902-Amphidinium_carterae.2